jgi:hypothetical protein
MIGGTALTSTVVVGVLVALLVGIVLALIFDEKFRASLLGGDGEVVFGFLSVRGAAFILLSGLLIGAVLYLLRNAPSPMYSPPQNGEVYAVYRQPLQFAPQQGSNVRVAEAIMKCEKGADLVAGADCTKDRESCWTKYQHPSSGTWPLRIETDSEDSAGYAFIVCKVGHR